MSDEEAKTAPSPRTCCAKTCPFEEALAALPSFGRNPRYGRSEICSRYGKGETFVRGRINLNKLIPEVAQMLENEEIGVEMASEFANYEDTIQKEVYDQHFRNEGYFSWKGIQSRRIQETALRQVYDQTRQLLFDKTEVPPAGITPSIRYCSPIAETAPVARTMPACRTRTEVPCRPLHRALRTDQHNT